MRDKHEITDKIRELLRKEAGSGYGDKAAFCRQYGFTSYSLSGIMSGKRKYVFGDDWARLCRALPEISDMSPSAILAIQGECQEAIDADAVIRDFKARLISSIINMDNFDKKDEILKMINQAR